MSPSSAICFTAYCTALMFAPSTRSFLLGDFHVCLAECLGNRFLLLGNDGLFFQRRLLGTTDQKCNGQT